MSDDPWRVEYQCGGTWGIRAAVGRGLASMGYLSGVPEDNRLHTPCWPAWASEIYYRIDGEEIGYIRALAKGPQGPRDMLDAAYRLGRKAAVDAILKPFFSKRKRSPRLLIEYLENYR